MIIDLLGRQQKCGNVVMYPSFVRGRFRKSKPNLLLILDQSNVDDS